jgi:hypothetical protein
VTLIETRGEGGYAICPPSNGYEPIQGELTQLPRITKEERDFLIRTARLFHAISNDADTPLLHSDKTTGAETDRLRPGDDFNQRGWWVWGGFGGDADGFGGDLGKSIKQSSKQAIKQAIKQTRLSSPCFTGKKAWEQKAL